jgi:hypothetical protein
MARFIEQGAAVTICLGPFVDKGDGCTAETGLSTAYTSIFLSKNGGDLTAKHETTALAHAGAGAAATSLGYYHCLLDATDTDTLGKLRLMVSDDATHLPVWQDYQVVTHDFYQSMSGDHVLGAAAVSDIHTDVGTVITNLGTVDGIVDDIHTTLDDVHTDVGTAITAIGDMHATDLPDLHTDVGSVLTKLGTIVNTGGTASIGAVLGDFANSALVTRVADLHTDVADNHTDIADLHTDLGTAITNIGTVDTVVDGIEAHVHTIDGHITADYTATEKAAIDLLDDADGGLGDIHTVVNDIHADVGTVHTDVDAILADTGELQTDWANGGRLDLLLDGATAPSAATVADAVWNEATADHSGAGTTGLAVASSSAPSAASIADAVWDEASTGHTDAGKAGTQLWTQLGDVHTDVGTAVSDIAATHAHAAAADSQTTAASIATAVWGALASTYNTVLTFGKYLGGAPAGATLAADVADVHTDVGDIHTDLGTAQTMLTDIHGTDLPDLHTDVGTAVTQATAAAADALAAHSAIDDATSGLAAIHTDLGSVGVDLTPVTNAIAALPTDADVQAAAAAALTAYDPPTKTEMDTAVSTIDLSGLSVSVDLTPLTTAVNLAIAAVSGADVTVISPVAATGAVTIYQGDDYAASEARQLSFLVADAGHAIDMDAGAAVVSLKMVQATWTASSVTSTTAGYTVTFEPTAAQTAALTMARQRYELEVVLAGGHVVTLATGSVSLVDDIPTVTP